MTYSATTPYLPDTDCIIYAQILIPPKKQGTHNQLRDTTPIIAPKLYSEVVAFKLIVKAYNKKKVAFGKTKTKTMNIITSMIALKPSSFVLRSTAYLFGGLSHE